MKRIYGWWFSAKKTLPHGDDRRIAVGRTHKVKGEIVLCKHGLHLSERALDALHYGHGSIVWRVCAGGTIVKGNDKIACSQRTYLAGGIDVSGCLQQFARLCALDVIDLWDAPKIVRRYLRSGDTSLTLAARAAARTGYNGATPATDAAAAAALAAATRIIMAKHNARLSCRQLADAAALAAYNAAIGAARAAAARAAAALDATASSAAYAAAADKQNRRLHRMLLEAIRQ